MDLNTKEQRDEHRKSHLSLNHDQRQPKRIKLNKVASSLLLRSNNIYKDNYEFHYQLNIQAMLMAFYLGTGGYDIGTIAYFLEIPDG